MNQRIVIILARALFFSLSQMAEPVLAGDVSSGLPHRISLSIEPESVSVESPAKLTITFIPFEDVDSLSIYLKLLPEANAQVFGALQRGWQGSGKKGQAITISGTAIFHGPGYYGANVQYKHRDPRGFAEIIGDTKVFVIRAPGGIQEPGRIEDRLPLRMKIPRASVGGAQVPGNIGGGIRPLVRVGPSVLERPCWVWEKFGATGGKDTLGISPKGQPYLPDTTLILVPPGVTGFVSPLSPPCNDTAQVIAACDILVQLGDPPLDASNWRIDPWWLGTIEELPDHRARFTAGSSAGLGNIWCDYGSYSYYLAVMVIANYHLEGSFLYKSRNLSQDLPARRSLVALFTADPQANDLVLPIDNQEVHFRFVLGAYANDDGFYQFDDLNVDSIAVLLLTTCSSHEVGYWNEEEYWVPYGWCYYWFEFQCLMHYLAPSISAGPISFSDDARAALNIMSLTQLGVDYLVELPGSGTPDKVFIYWNPDDPADNSSGYAPGYDFIQVAGWHEALNTDEWDQDVFLHEYGHFVMDNYAAFPTEVPNCDPHFWQVSSSPECAYAEGWATFYSCACQPDRIYLDTNRDTSIYLRDDVELPSKDPQGDDVEGAVCASLWDVFDYANDGTVWGEDRWCHNDDQNAGLWWQEIDEIWYTFGEASYSGHFPYTICEFKMTWTSKNYPTDPVWQNIFNAHGIECTPEGVEEDLASMSTTTSFLWPNHPNPFNPLTQIAFGVANHGRVSVRVCDAGGRVVKTLLDSCKGPGIYTMWWDGKDDSGGIVASGVYFCHLVAGSFEQTRKLVMLR